MVGVGLGVDRDLFRRERRTRDVAACGIADQRSEIADQEYDVMAQILQLSQLVELNRVTKVKIGTRRIEPLLDVERLAARQLCTQLALDKELVGAAPEDLHLLFEVEGHPEGPPC